MKKHIKYFSLYVIFGVVWSALNVFFMWLVLDIIRMPTLLGSTLVVFGTFILRYYSGLFIGLLKPSFIKYTITNISFSLANIFLVWFFIEILFIPVVIASAVPVVILFILKYFVFNMLGVIKVK